MSLYKLYFCQRRNGDCPAHQPGKLPETLSADNGSYNVLGLGPIMQPRTPNLRTVSISACCPGGGCRARPAFICPRRCIWHSSPPP